MLHFLVQFAECVNRVGSAAMVLLVRAFHRVYVHSPEHLQAWINANYPLLHGNLRGFLERCVLSTAGYSIDLC